MRKLFLFPSVMVVNCVLSWSVLAQDLPKVLDAPVEFDKGEQKKIDKANEQINKALAIWNRLVKEYNPDNITNYKTDSLYYVRAYPLLVEAAKNMEEGNNAKFEVYRKNNQIFWNKHKYDSPSGLESAKILQKEATNYFQKSQLNRTAAASYSKEYGKAFARFHEAFSLEIIAVKKEGRALQLYRDWPIHYDYVFDEDIIKNLFPKDYKPGTPVITANLPEKKDTAKKDSVIEKKIPEVPVVVKPVLEPYDSTVIYYQVQIVAHTAPLNESYIRSNVYNGDLPVEMLKEEGWYKYVIGRYRNVEDASQLLKKLNIPKAFVVAYKNHKRVTIKDASGGGK